MLQVLDYFRRLYKQETSKEPSESPPPVGVPLPYLMFPTWEYVCWLEGRLSKYEKEPLPEGKMTYAVLKEDVAAYLKERA